MPGRIRTNPPFSLAYGRCGISWKLQVRPKWVQQESHSYTVFTALKVSEAVDNLQCVDWAYRRGFRGILERSGWVPFRAIASGNLPNLLDPGRPVPGSRSRFY
jgi:hypothetical protein